MAWDSLQEEPSGNVLIAWLKLLFRHRYRVRHCNRLPWACSKVNSRVGRISSDLIQQRATQMQAGELLKRWQLEVHCRNRTDFPNEYKFVIPSSAAQVGSYRFRDFFTIRLKPELNRRITIYIRPKILLYGYGSPTKCLEPNQTEPNANTNKSSLAVVLWLGIGERVRQGRPISLWGFVLMFSYAFCRKVVWNTSESFLS